MPALREQMALANPSGCLCRQLDRAARLLAATSSEPHSILTPSGNNRQRDQRTRRRRGSVGRLLGRANRRRLRQLPLLRPLPLSGLLCGPLDPLLPHLRKIVGAAVAGVRRDPASRQCQKNLTIGYPRPGVGASVRTRRARRSLPVRRSGSPSSTRSISTGLPGQGARRTRSASAAPSISSAASRTACSTTET